MPHLDLDALARAVEAVLERHGVPAEHRDIRLTGGTILDVTRSTDDATEGWQWQIHVHDWEEGPWIDFDGHVSPDAFDVLTTVWGRVNGQGDESERYGRVVEAAKHVRQSALPLVQACQQRALLDRGSPLAAAADELALMLMLFDHALDALGAQP